MKIAILTPTFSKFSGIDRVVELQAEELAEKGNEVVIFCLKGNLKTKAGVIEMGMPESPLFERLYRLFFFLDFRKINQYLNQLKDYDLIISHLYPMNILAAKAKKKYGARYVFHNHGVGIAEYSPLEVIYLRLFNYLTNRTIRNCDYVVSVSKYLADVLERETGIKSREIAYDKIDTKRFHKGISGKTVREKYNMQNEPVLLYVGRISPHKGVHLLLEAFRIVQGEFPNAKLIIVGKFTFNKYGKKLKKMADNNIIFTGFVDDKELPCYYAACDVYTTASLWEGFNLTVAEANACGKPVVAFRLAAHPETVKNGTLVEPRNIKEFADAVIRLLKTR